MSLSFKSSLNNEYLSFDQYSYLQAFAGLGVIGLELGQALHRLGLKVVGIGRDSSLGGASSPEVLKAIKSQIGNEMTLEFGEAELMAINDQGKLEIKVAEKIIVVDRALVAVGRAPNLKGLNLDALGINLSPNGMPEVNQVNYSLKQAPHLFLAGDANGLRPLLHEAADQGFIAGQAIVHGLNSCFESRTPLAITFTEPNIASAGLRYHELIEAGIEFELGVTQFKSLGRAITKLENHGMAEVYINKQDGTLLGTEFFAPGAEHMVHLLALAIHQKMSVFDLLTMPFYHPVLEEGLRGALRDAASKVKSLTGERQLELKRCQSWG
jgi:dihydrolipoamide dehydrogenase